MWSRWYSASNVNDVEASGCHFSAGSQLLLLDGQGLLSGSFDQVTLSGFAPGTFSVVYDSANADVWLNVMQDVAAVPEPATTALWLVGLAGLGVASRRRSAHQRRGGPLDAGARR